MNNEQFIQAIIKQVHEISVSGLIQEMTDGPRGRRPAKNLIILHKWFLDLSPDEKLIVENSIEHAVHSAIFGLLCVLDGARIIEDGGGQFP